MQRFSELSETSARRIDRAIMGMARLESLEALEVRFLQEAGKLLPADCLCWNNWAPDLSHLISFRNNDSHMEPFEKLLPVFSETVQYHPVIVANQFAATTEQVTRLSDFESGRRFKENPLFREVYRHVDSRFQLGHTPCVLPDRRILLTWNRRALDFTEQERHIFYFIGMRLGVISRHIAEKQRLEMSWQGLCQFVDVRTGAGAASSLATQDVHLLTALLKTGTRKSIAGAMGIRRDSVDKRLGAIRERLGLENHYQLLSALAELTKLSLEPGKSSTDHEIGVTR